MPANWPVLGLAATTEYRQGRSKRFQAAGQLPGPGRVDRCADSRLGEVASRTVAFRDGPEGKLVTSRFAFVRVRSVYHWRPHEHKWATGDQPCEEWLIAEWPKGAVEPSDYWISNLPANTK